MGQDQVKGQLDGLLLSVLEAGPLHGYAVIEALRERVGRHPGAADRAPSTRRCGGWRTPAGCRASGRRSAVAATPDLPP